MKEYSRIFVESEKKNFLWTLKYLVVLLISSIVYFIINNTNFYDDFLVKHAVLKNNSLIYNWWFNPPLNVKIDIFIFNYTNIDEFLNGTAEKIKLEEIGPYTFNEVRERVNLKFEGDFVTFNINRSFIPIENSLESDFVNTINLPLASAASRIFDYGPIGELAFRAGLILTQPKDFHTLKVKDFFFGYEDKFLNTVQKVKWDMKPRDFFMLTAYEGISRDKFTINLGLSDVEKTCQYSAVNGRKYLDTWKSKNCNQIQGSEGFFYGPKRVREKRDIFVYLPEFCLKIPLKFEKKSSIYGIESSLYSLKDIQIFSEGDEFYCEPKNNPNTQINGTIDLSNCVFQKPPIFGSFPHFIGGDEKLFELFDGLQPNKNGNFTFAHIHPRLGFPLNGESTFQINIKVKSFGRHYEKLDGMVLPIAWAKKYVVDLPLRMKILLHLIEWTEPTFNCFSILGIILSIYFLVYRILKVFLVGNDEEEI